MSCSRVIPLILTLSLLSAVTPAQEPTQSASGSSATASSPPAQGLPPNPSTLPWNAPQVTRDSQALQAIGTALTALGGSAAIAQLGSCTIQGQVDVLTPKGGQTGSFTWRAAGQEFRGDFSNSAITSSVATGHGNPVGVSNGSSLTIPAQFVRAYFIPPLVALTLLNEFQTTTYSLRYIGPAQIGTEPVTVVQTSSQATRLDSQVTLQKWYFDATSGLPVRVEYRLPDNHQPSKFATETVDLSNYESVSGILYPFQAVKSVAGHTAETITVTTIQPNSTISPSVFDSVTGGLQ